MAEESIALYVLLRAHCASKRCSIEMRRHREHMFKARGRVFAFVNSPFDPAVTVKPRRAMRKGLLREPAVTSARWIGWLGWITVRVRDQQTLALALRVIDDSYARATRGAVP